jgi:hypothetical protein
MAIPAAIVGGAVLGAYSSRKASKAQTGAAREATAAQTEASREAIESQERMFERQIAEYAPFKEIGVEYGIPELLEMTKDPETNKYEAMLEYMVTGEGTPVDFRESPMRQYRLEKGQESLDKYLASKGQYFSGKSIPAYNELLQRVDAEESENLYNRLKDMYAIGEGNINRQYGKALDLVNIGRGAATQTGAAMQTHGENLATGAYNIGQARATGAYGAGAAKADMYGNIANIGVGGLNAYIQYQQYQNIMDKFSPTV